MKRGNKKGKTIRLIDKSTNPQKYITKIGDIQPIKRNPLKKLDKCRCKGNDTKAK